MWGKRPVKLYFSWPDDEYNFWYVSSYKTEQAAIQAANDMSRNWISGKFKLRDVRAGIDSIYEFTIDAKEN